MIPGMPNIPESTPKSAAPQWLRPLRRVFLVALALALSYLALANLALNSGLVEHWINRKPERFTLHWQRATTWWPGQISATALSLQGQSGHLRWRIDNEHAEGRIALLPLLRKELRFTRIDSAAPTAIALERAEIALPKPEPRPNGLKLAFDEVRLDAPLQFAFGQLSLIGKAKARAAWHQQLRGGPFALAPSELEFVEANLWYDTRLLLDGASVSTQASIDEHLRREAPGLAMLEHVSATLAIEGATPGLLLDVARDAKLSPQILDSLGHAKATIGLSQGQLQAGSRIDATVPLGAQLENGPQTSGDARLEVAVGDDIAVKLQLPPVEGLLQEIDAELRLAGRELPLPPFAEQTQRLFGQARLRANFDSLAWIRPLLSKLPGIALSGKGAMNAQLNIARGHIAAGTRIDVEQAQFTLDAYGHRFTGKVRGQAQTGGDQGDTKVDLSFERYSVAALDAPDQPLGDGRGLTLSLSSSGPLGQLHERVRARLRFANAQVPDLTRFKRYQTQGGIDILSGSGAISADMRMHVEDNRSEGMLMVDARNAAVKIGELAVQTDLKLEAKLQGGKLDVAAFSADGSTLQLANARILEPAGEHAAPWNAKLRIERGHADLRKEIRIDGQAHIEMQDASFLLSLYATRKTMPKWIGKIIDAGHVRVNGRVQLHGRALVLEDLSANNNRFELQGRLRLAGEKPDGDLYANWGALGLGLELRQGKRDFRFIKPKQWYETQPPFLAERRPR